MALGVVKWRRFTKLDLASRGDVKRPGREVVRGATSGVEALPSRFDIPKEAPEGKRRAALARWITDPKNPLTWRTIVNRAWQYHFGRGLVETPNNFGRMARCLRIPSCSTGSR